MVENKVDLFSSFPFWQGRVCIIVALNLHCGICHKTKQLYFCDQRITKFNNVCLLHNYDFPHICFC